MVDNINKSTKILCVCTHNYFRSQIMEWVLRSRGYTNVKSAGVLSAYLGHKAFPYVIDAINKRGGNCTDYLAHQLTIEDVQWSDFILCAEEQHSEHIKRMIASEKPIGAWVAVLGIHDGGVTNLDAVEKAATEIVEWFDKWTW